MKNKLRTKAKILYAVRDFIHTLPYHLLVMGSVFVIAIIFKKYAEAICFLTAFFSLRYKFDTTYHSDNIVVCMTLTISMFCLSIVMCPPIYMYISLSILFAYLDCFMLWFIKDRLDKKEQNKYLQAKLDEVFSQLKEYRNIDLYKMSENDLRQYCASQQLSETQQDIVCMRVLQHLKISEICRYYNYGRSTIKYHIAEIKKKLKIDNI